MERPKTVHERALVPVPIVVPDGRAVEDIVLAALGRETKPITSDNGVEVIHGVGVPLPEEVWAVKGYREGEEGDPAHGVDDGELGDASCAPGKMNQGDLLGAGDEIAPGRFAELPRPVIGVAAEVPELDEEAVICYGGDGACLGPGDASAELD